MVWEKDKRKEGVGRPAATMNIDRTEKVSYFHVGRINKQLRIVILTSKLPEDVWLVNKIAEVSKIEGIVLPTKSRYGQFGIFQVFKKRIRRSGILGVVNQALLVLYRLIFERGKDKKALKNIFTDKTYQYIERKDIDTLEINDINSEEVENFILSKAPDLVVVSGTPLLKKRIIGASQGRIINLHPGLAPQYRGRYGSFWPIYYRKPELVGVTVHFLDRGIDTGPILIQQQVDYDPSDTLKIITYKQHRTGVELLIKCLTQFDTMASQAYHKTDCPSNNYLAPGIIQYLRARRWLRAQKASSPPVLEDKIETPCPEIIKCDTATDKPTINLH